MIWGDIAIYFLKFRFGLITNRYCGIIEVVVRSLLRKRSTRLGVDSPLRVFLVASENTIFLL
jgi:hypothetical protein